MGKRRQKVTRTAAVPDGREIEEAAEIAETSAVISKRATGKRSRIGADAAVKSETVGPPFSFHRRYRPADKAQACIKGVVDGAATKNHRSDQHLGVEAICKSHRHSLGRVGAWFDHDQAVRN